MCDQREGEQYAGRHEIGGRGAREEGPREPPIGEQKEGDGDTPAVSSALRSAFELRPNRYAGKGGVMAWVFGLRWHVLIGTGTIREAKHKVRVGSASRWCGRRVRHQSSGTM
ncbi:hypothetical protein ASA1KI_27320 [Opitutales bacterium ASA1]|nr:hypothetical protein ASA1KI_27320 [Opitutales bacterium ASA1]